MEQLAEMPPFAWVIFAVTTAVIFGVRQFGLLQGARSTPASSPAAAQVAAVIVDPTALNRATDAVNAHTDATRKLAEDIKEAGRHVQLMAIEVDRIREDMRIDRELRRNQPR